MDFVGLLVLSAMVDGALVLGVLLRGGGRIGIARCALAALLGGAAWVGKAALLGSTFDLTLFAWVALAYVDCVVVLPLVGAAVLAAGARADAMGARRATWPVLAGAVCALGAAPVGVWASLVEPRWVEFSEIDVPVAPEHTGFGAVRIVVLADVQTDRIGAYEMGVADRVNALDPDIVIVPGDLFQHRYGVWSKASPRFDEVRAGFVEFLSRLDAPGGVYFVPGNTELWYDWRSVVRDAGVVDLSNRVERTRIVRAGVDREIVIAGTEWVYDTPDAGRVRAALEGETGGPIVVYATHTPDGFMLLGEDSRVDLSIAGHTHGGQVRIPGWGAPMTMSRLAPRAVGSGGLHRVSGHSVYVSRGVGMERGHAPPLRLFCRPEVAVLEVGGSGHEMGSMASIEASALPD